MTSTPAPKVRTFVDGVVVDRNAVTLPVPAIKDWDKEARARLEITDQRSFRHYLQHFPFETVSAIVRAIENVSTLDSRYPEYAFERFKFATIEDGNSLLTYYLFGNPREEFLYPNRSPQVRSLRNRLNVSSR